MRSFLVPLGLLAALPLAAGGAEGHWFLDVHSMAGTFEGHYIGTQDDKPFLVDFKSDLALNRDKAKTGFGLEYQGPRFGLELSVDTQDYKGSNQINRAVVIDGQTFDVGAKVTSTVKSTLTVFNWTIRALAFEHAWLGIDLGVRGVNLDMQAHGSEPFSGTTAEAAWKGGYPIPQVGLSAGLNLANGRVLARGFYHMPRYHGASYTVTGGDIRVFPWSWLGVRAFTTTEKLRVPKGSIGDEIDIALDMTGSGFGVVVRF